MDFAMPSKRKQVSRINTHRQAQIPVCMLATASLGNNVHRGTMSSLCWVQAAPVAAYFEEGEAMACPQSQNAALHETRIVIDREKSNTVGIYADLEPGKSISLSQGSGSPFKS